MLVVCFVCFLVWLFVSLHVVFLIVLCVLIRCCCCFVCVHVFRMLWLLHVFLFWFVIVGRFLMLMIVFMVIRLFVFGCFVVYPLFFRLFKVVVVCVPIVCLFCVNVLLLMIVVFLCAC